MMLPVVGFGWIGLLFIAFTPRHSEVVALMPGTMRTIVELPRENPGATPDTSWVVLIDLDIGEEARIAVDELPQIGSRICVSAVLSTNAFGTYQHYIYSGPVQIIESRKQECAAKQPIVGRTDYDPNLALVKTVSIIIALVAAYLAVLAVVIVLRDKTLSLLQKIAQGSISICVPVLGPLTILYMAHPVTPQLLRWVPWPFKDMVADVDLRRLSEDERVPPSF